MVLFSLTNKTYTPWGKQYKQFHWKSSWWVFINFANKERATMEFNEVKPVNHIIYWFDTEVLQKIGKDTVFTLDVRIRIVCGMINKLPYNKISMDMKREFMECIWDTYQKFSRDYMDYYCMYVIELPF